MLRYLTIEELIQIHDEIVKNYGGLGGTMGDKIGLVDSALHQIQNDEYYPNMLAKVSHLCFAIIMFHGFADGNKRTALEATDLFLQMNGYPIPEFIVKMEDIAVGVAKGAMKEPELKKHFQLLFASFGHIGK